MLPVLELFLCHLLTTRNYMSYHLSSHILHIPSILFSSTALPVLLILSSCSCVTISILSFSFFKPLCFNHWQDFLPLTSSVATKYPPRSALIQQGFSLSSWISLFFTLGYCSLFPDFVHRHVFFMLVTSIYTSSSTLINPFHLFFMSHTFFIFIILCMVSPGYCQYYYFFIQFM